MTIHHQGVVTIEHLKRFMVNHDSVRFDNGCFFSFSGDSWGGDDPYGQEAILCNYKDKSELNSILNWLVYWDDSRDERGNIITPEDHCC